MVHITENYTTNAMCLCYCDIKEAIKRMTKSMMPFAYRITHALREIHGYVCGSLYLQGLAIVDKEKRN